MPATPRFQLSVVSYDPQTGQVVYKDGTGNYDAALNPGGYGGPNAGRAAYALYCVGERRETAARVPLAAARTPTALAGDVFRLLPLKDGWLAAYLCAVPVGDTSTPPPPAPDLPAPAEAVTAPTPALAPLVAPAPVALPTPTPTGYFRHDPALDRLMQRYAALDDAGQTVSTWQTATAEELLGSAYAVATANALVVGQAKLLRARLNERLILLANDLVADQFRQPQQARLTQVFNLVRAYLEGADTQWKAGNYYFAQQDLESLALLGATELVAL